MNNQKLVINQQGSVALLLSVAAIGIIAVFGIISLAPFKKGLLTSLSEVNTSFAATTVNKYDVFELTLTYPSTSLSDPYNNALVNATFTSPSGKTLKVPGFYYDVNTYKVRFSPAEIGDYSYSVSIAGPTAFTPQTGSFTSITSTNHGPLRKVPGSPYKLMYDDGSPFYGIGLNDCWTNDTNLGTITTLTGVIGELAVEPAGEGGQVPITTYFQKYGQAGFNLHRWNPGNCSFKIFNAPNPVLAGKYGDQLLQTAKSYGFHNLYTFFYDTNGIPDPTQHPNEDATLKNYIRYAVARFGAYVDFWEFTNETTTSPSDNWMTYTKNYLRSIDADQKLVTNSGPRATDANFLDIASPHKYGSNDDFFNLNNKTTGLPMVLGEIGRCAGCSTTTYNQQIRAKMRAINWTSFIAGIGAIYWNSSWKTTCCNQYMGSTERSHTAVLDSFVKNTLIDTNATASPLITGTNRTGYSLTSTNSVVGYIFDNSFGSSAVTTTVTLNIPFNATLSWIDTKTGTTISSTTVMSGTKTLTTPSFIEDVAFKAISSTAASPTPSTSVPVSPSPSPSATPNSSPTPNASPPKVGDIISNNKVDLYDYNALLTDFGKKNDAVTKADLDDDNDVDLYDYNILLTNFGR